MLELADLDDRVRPGHADHGREVADPLGREAPPAQARDRGHPRVVPAPHVALGHEPEQHPLREHGVGEVEPRELVLVGHVRHREVLDEPVVERPVDLELERADRMGDPLDGVGLTVREVVRGVDAPGVAGPRVGRVDDPVEHRIAEVDVRRRHVDPRPQHPRAVGELARAHAREQVEVLGHRSLPVRRVRAGRGQRPARLADLLGRQVVDIGEAALDEVDGPRVELLEVVRRVEQVVAPVEAQPPDVRLDRVQVLLLLLDRVRVVEAEVAVAAELLGQAEVEADRLGMADVEVAVGLRREARHRGGDPSGREIGRHDVADEVRAFRRVDGGGVEAVIGAAPATGMGRGDAAHAAHHTPGGVGWRARIRTWNPLIQSQVLYR